MPDELNVSNDTKKLIERNSHNMTPWCYPYLTDVTPCTPRIASTHLLTH